MSITVYSECVLLNKGDIHKTQPDKEWENKRS